MHTLTFTPGQAVHIHRPHRSGNGWLCRFCEYSDAFADMAWVVYCVADPGVLPDALNYRTQNSAQRRVLLPLSQLLPL